MKVLFFGPVRTQLGVDHFDIAAGKMSRDELWANLVGQFPALKPLRPAIRLARNGEFLPPGARLEPGDEIALIPPVSGG
jgi:molybdopterin converting factor small subunit